MSAGQAMAAMAVQLGVPKQAIIMENASWDTEDEARLLRQRLDGRAFALVTSAIHMPRSMSLVSGLWFESGGRAMRFSHQGYAP